MSEQASEMAGWPLPKEGTFCWTEIASNDADKCQAFYESVFGWKFKGGGAGSDGMDYREYSPSGGNPVGGLYQIVPEWFGGDPPLPHVMIYITVDNMDENAKRVTDLGGKIHKEPMDIPNVGRMCMIKDPSGAMFCTFQMKN